jgi:hypothetical protein
MMPKIVNGKLPERVELNLFAEGGLSPRNRHQRTRAATTFCSPAAAICE